MAGLSTTSTVLHLASLSATCPYCLVQLDFAQPPAGVTELKLECAGCNLRFLLKSTGFNQTQYFPLALGFPPEIISSVLAHVRDDTTLLSAAVVCKLWNGCAENLLYDTLELAWDSRATKALLRTVESRPALLALVRHISIHFRDPFKFDPYISDEDLRRMRSEEYRLLVQRLGLPQDPQDAYDDLVFAEDYGEHEEEVTKRVKPRFLECLRSRGEGHWADLDGTRRREGALALYHFLGRCSRLSYLDIYAFDFGEAPGISPVQIPPLLSLTDVKMSNIDSAASHFILSHTPNLETLSITTDWDEQFEAFALLPLPKLRTITLDLFSNENLPLLIDIIDACGPALRELSFNFSEWHMEQDIPNILRKVPQLGSLSIYMDWEHFERRRGKTLPTYPLLRALSSSALTSIYLSCHPSLPILNSLPPTLVSLDLEWIFDTRPWHPVTLNISEILQVVLGLKRTSRHRRWKLFILQYYPESDEGMDPAVAGLLDAAKEAGLKVVI